jgi:hypothetical protein
MKRHRIGIQSLDDSRFMAKTTYRPIWEWGDDPGGSDAIYMDEHPINAIGDSEEDALQNIAVKLGIPLWHEEQYENERITQ